MGMEGLARWREIEGMVMAECICAGLQVPPADGPGQHCLAGQSQVATKEDELIE